MSFLMLTHADSVKQEMCRQRGEAVLRGLGLPCVTRLHTVGTMLYAAAPQAGVLQTHCTDLETSVLLGYALDENGTALTPQRLAKRWREQPSFQPDGFFMAAVVRSDGSLSIAVDPLGLFPCLYTQLPDGGWLLATAARDLCIHPDFKVKPDPEGIAGQLLLNNPIENRTVLAGVRQIPIRTVLHLQKGCPPRFAEAPLPAPAAVATRREANEEFARLWTLAVRKHSAVQNGGKADLLLSGGRDSRMVGATVLAQGHRVRCVTLGLPREYEAQAAKAVSRALKTEGFLLLRDQDPARLLRIWDQRALRCGGRGGGSFGGLGPDPSLRPWMHHGILLDLLLGGYATGFSWDTELRRHRPSLFFENLNLWGLPEDALPALFRDAEAGGLGRQLRERMLADFDRRAEEPAQASFDWLHATRSRHHLGASLWEYTQNTWPIVPACDQPLYAFIRSLPFDWVNDRALQKTWMEKHVPDLLQIPFESNTHSFAPERPTWRWPAWRRRLFAPAQPLRYHRVFAAGSPGWRAVAREAHAARPALYEFFHPEVLDRLWPEKLSDHPHTNPFAELAGIRSLMVLAGFFAQKDLSA